MKDFDLRGVYEALDVQRRTRHLSWAGVAEQVNGGARKGAGQHRLAVSTITRLAHQQVAEGDGVLQILLWLDRSPESFVPDLPDTQSERFRLPRPAAGQVLRWDAIALYAALDARRRDRALTWSALVREVGGFTPGMVARLATGPRVTLPRVMRLVQWLDQPAAKFTRLLSRRGHAY